MPTVRVFENSDAAKYKDLVYDFIEESLSSLLKKYDPSFDPQSVTVACGSDSFLDFDTKVSACLFYGKAISFYNHKISIRIDSNAIQITEKPSHVEIDSRSSLGDLKKSIMQSFS